MPYYYRSKRRFRKRRAVKGYSAIILVCFVAAAGLTFVMEKANAVIDRFDRIPWEQLDKISLERVKRTYGGKLEDADVEKLMNAYKQNVDARDMEKLKKSYGRKISADDVEKLRKAHEGRLDA